MIKRLTIAWLILVCVIMLAGLFTWRSDKLQTNILSFLPQYQDEKVQAVLVKISDKINNTVILAIGANDQAQARLNAEKISQRLQTSQLFSKVQLEFDISAAQEIYQLLSPYRHQLLSQTNRKNLEKADFSSIISAAKQRLYGFQNLTKAQFFQDPAFLFQNYLTELVQKNNAIALDAGYFYVLKQNNNESNSHYYLIFAHLNNSAFLLDYQTKVNAFLSDIVQEFSQSPKDSGAISNVANAKNKEQNSSSVSILATIRYAAEAAADANQEMSLIGAGSTIGIILLFLIIFKSVKPLLITIISIACSILIAFIVTFICFGSIHMFTLVFSATIIGITVDYYWHYLIDRAQQHSSTSLFKALTLSFVTTALGFLGFIFAGMEILAQVAVFTVLGLLVSYINVILIVPQIIQQEQFPVHATMLTKMKYALNSVNFLQKIPHKGWFLITLALGLMTIFIIKPNDDVKAMQQLSPELKKQEMLIRDLIHLPNSGQYAVIFAPTLDELLEQENQLLSRAEFSQIPALSTNFPSPTQQKENAKLQASFYQSDEFNHYFSQFHNDSAQVNGSQTNLDNWQFINYEKFFDNKTVAQTLFANVVSMPEHRLYALIIPLPASINASQILEQATAINLKNNIVLINQSADISHLLGTYRSHINWILTTAVVAIFLFLGKLYGLRQALIILIIPLVSIFASLLITYSLGYEISLFSSLACLLLLGMSIDYIVFTLETQRSLASVLAMLLACVTTLFSFGLLAISHIFVIASFGVTVSIGILLTLVLALGSNYQSLAYKNK